MRSGQQLSTRGGGYGVTGYSGGGYGGNDPVEQMFQVMEQLASSLGTSLVGRRRGILGQGQQGGGQPVSYVPLDVTENNEQYQIVAELPGANQQDIEVTVEGDNTLLIRAQKQQQTQQQQGHSLIQEREQGTYLRTLTLPQHVDRDNIRANFNNGVLEIVVPKSREHQQQQKRIQIQAGGGTGGSGSGSGSRT